MGGMVSATAIQALLNATGCGLHFAPTRLRLHQSWSLSFARGADEERGSFGAMVMSRCERSVVHQKFVQG